MEYFKHNCYQGIVIMPLFKICKTEIANAALDHIVTTDYILDAGIQNKKGQRRSWHTAKCN